MSWAFQPLLPSAVVLTGSTLNSYTLVAEVGSLSLVRNDAALKKAKTLTADVATFTEDLKPANLTVGRKVVADCYADVTLFTDNFNVGTANTPLTGYTQQGDNDIVYTGTGTIKQNGNNRAVAYRPDIPYNANQWAEITIAKLDTSFNCGVALRVQTSSSKPTEKTYHFTTNDAISAPGFSLSVYDNSSALTDLAFFSAQPAVGDRLRFEAVGNVLSGYVNGKLVIRLTNNIWSSGQAGIKGAGVVWESDNFASGNYGGLHFDALPAATKVDRRLSCDPAIYTEDLKPANLIAARSLTAKVYADEQLFSDDFTGAAGLLGSNYTQQGDINLRLDGLGNVHSLANGRGLAWPNTVSFENNQYAEITLTEISYAASAGSGLVLRVQTNESPGVEKSYIFRTGNAGAAYAVAKYNETSGVVTIRTASRIPEVGDRLRAVASGNTLYFYVNDQLIAVESDVSWPGGVPGIYGFNQQWKSDNFVAGNYGGLHLAGTYTNTRAARRLVCASASYTLLLKDAALIKRTLKAATGFFGLTTNSFSNIFTDNFNRADSSSLGANWQVNQNTFRIVSNQVRGSTTYNQTSLANVVSGTYNSDQFAEITATIGGDVVGPGVRINGKSGYYLGVFSNQFDATDKIRYVLLYKIDSSGVVTELLYLTPEIEGPLLTARISIVGNKISLYVNNNLITTFIDNTYSSGVPGLYYRNFLFGTTSGDNFIAGNAVDNANLKVSRTLFCTSVSYTLELKDATLTKTTTARTLLAETATYNENLQPANLKVGKRLVADTQSYSEDLKPANLRVTRRLVAEQQTYNEDLKPANLKVGKRLVADTVTYNETLRDANLKVGKRLVADTFTYNETLRDANLKVGKRLVAEQQTYNEDLKPANLKVGKRLVADRRIYSISTSETTFRLGRRIAADKQTYVLTGIVASFKTAGSLIADARSYTLTGNPAGTLRFAKLSAAATSYTFTGNATSLTHGKKLVADTASYNETLRDATLRVTRKVTADTRSYSFSGQNANLQVGKKLTADSRSYTFTGNAANLLKSTIVRTQHFRANLVPNSEATGAVVGVIGSGGVLPSGWTVGAATGITREIVATGIMPDGNSYIDIRWSGTNSSGSIVYTDLYVVPANSVKAYVGDKFTTSIYMKTLAGSRVGFSSSVNRIAVMEVSTPSGIYLAESSVIVPEDSRASVSRTFSVSNVGTARVYSTFSIPAGNTVDVTVRFSAPQLEPGLTATAYIPTTGTQVFRAYSFAGQPTNLLKNSRLVSDVRPYALNGGDTTFRLTRRLAAEEFRANYIRNSMMVGTVAGTPGTAPSLWSTFGDAQVTRTIIGTGIDSTTGLTYIDVNFTGTNNTGSTVQVGVDPVFPTATVAEVGQTWISSGYFGLIAGSWPSASAFIGLAARNSAGTGLQTVSSSIKNISSSSLQRISSTITISDFNTKYVSTLIRIDIAASASINLTVRIAAPQLERGSVARTFIPTTNAVQYRWFELAGQSANLLENRRLVAESSSYTLIRNDATLKVTRRLVADTRSYALTGNNFFFGTAGKITADTRSYAFTGNAANLLKSTIVRTQHFRANLIPNSQATGAVVGVIGSGGLLPSGWTISAVTGITREIVATGTMPDGNPYIDIRWSGTNNSGAINYPDLYFIPGAGAGSTPAYVGDKFTSSVYIKTIAGSRSGFFTASNIIYVSEHSAAGAYLVGTGVIVPEDSRGSASRTFSNGNVSNARMFITMAIPAGNTVDVTLRISAPQLEPGLTATTYIPTTGTKVFRDYSFVGNNANTLVAKKVIADKATYTLTGRTANILAGERGPSDSRNFILTGNPANLTVTRKLISAVSSYTVTRNDANLKFGRKISLSLSSYVTSGTAANLLANRKIQLVRTFFDTNGYVEPGYTDPNYVSIDIGMRAARKLAAQVTNFNLNGIAVNVTRGGFIKVWTGSAWVSKPLKVWDGAAWVSKPLKIWDGTTWRIY